MKDYGYVKEYGEGVDRMCRELEAIGLPDPLFNNDYFILKTTVMSAAYEKLPIQNVKVADSHENMPIKDNKVAHTGETENMNRTTSPEKLPVDKYTKAYSDKAYNEPTINNLIVIYDQIEVNQVFGSAYIIKILDCSDRTARNLLAKLRDMDVVVPVKGKGKGMYRLKYDEEI